MAHEEESALLNAYIAEWSKYFSQCSFLPMPFQAMDTATSATNKAPKKAQEGNRVYTVGHGVGVEGGGVYTVGLSVRGVYTVGLPVGVGVGGSTQ